MITRTCYVTAAHRWHIDHSEVTSLAKHLCVGCTLLLLCCSPALLGLCELFRNGRIIAIKLLCFCEAFYCIIQLLQATQSSFSHQSTRHFHSKTWSSLWSGSAIQSLFPENMIRQSALIFAHLIAQTFCQTSTSLQ